MVFGSEVLHHLTDTLDAASLELRRVLKPDGLAVYSEPVHRSKLIAGLRKVFPKNDDEITEDERQLNPAALWKAPLARLRGSSSASPGSTEFSWCSLLRNASWAIPLS